MLVGCLVDPSAYLARTGYRGPVEPTAEVLRALHVAHLRSVPFENLDIHSGRPIVLDEAAFYRKVVEERRGGFCYELNGLFAWLLRQIGFRVTLLSAGVAKEGGGFGPEFDHLALRVDLDRPSLDGPYLADAGFGECFPEPLPLAEGTTGEYSLERAGEYWVLRRGAEPRYRFTLTPHELGEFAGMCHYHQTSPDSQFTRGRITTIATPDGRITLSGTRLIRASGGMLTVEEIPRADVPATLYRLFGIVLPLSISPMTAADWPEVRRIYAEGIQTGQATFETTAPDWEQWDIAHLGHSRLVVRDEGAIVGWAALGPLSRRLVYRGAAETGIYVAGTHRRRGIGTVLLRALIEASERNGIWTLQASIFPGVEAAERLYRRCGFREVGRRERIAQRDGAWCDTVLLERRSSVVGMA